MRLIDADALADALFDKRKNYPQWVAETIGNMPDAVVRCKDCRFGEPTKNMRGENRCACINYRTGIDPDFTHKPDWFCADGEKRTD